MSAHAGIFHRDGAPSQASEVDVCLPFLDRLGPEGGFTCAVGSVSFTHRIYRVTPESIAEQQPCMDTYGRVSTWDGRIDNREDLALQLADTLERNLSDAAYAHAAFARWGQSAFSRLLGEWAFAAWDPRTLELFLARDYSGCGPLFYYLTPRIVLWSSELEAVVAMARERRLPLTMDNGWIAGFFARGPEPTETPYREIRAVEPGCAIRIGTVSHEVRRHTWLDTHTAIRYRADADYEEHFRFLFKQAVACRLRSAGKVFCHLSGGLDSSSVAAMAAHLVRTNQAAVKLETISSVYDDTMAADESEYIGLMEDWLDLPAHRISESAYPALTPVELGYEPASPSYIDIFAAGQQAIRRTMEEANARVQLSGDGGDELLGNAVDGIPILRELIQDGLWADIPTAALKWSLATKRTVWRLATETLASCLPNTLVARAEFDSPVRVVGSNLSAAFRNRTDFHDRLYRDFEPFGFETFSQKVRAVALCSVIRRVAECGWRRIGPMGPSFPMLDRRLVSFLLAIPMASLARAASPRSLQRRALGPLLPPKLIMRRSKRSPDAAVFKRFAARFNEIQAQFDHAMVYDLGIVSKAKQTESLLRAKHGTFPVTIVAPPYLLERWLRSRSSSCEFHANHTPSRIPRRKEVNAQ